MQNSRPVATQFRADPMPRQVAPRRPEPKVDPFSESFKRQINIASGGRFKPVGSTREPSTFNPQSSSVNGIHEGIVIEHQRFGIGTVVKIEGTGDNEKATVQFQNVGTKQLLLKFAKFTIVK
jgi:DNA helicase-2/ATP-dependent DNA helicase PcrA